MTRPNIGLEPASLAQYVCVYEGEKKDIAMPSKSTACKRGTVSTIIQSFTVPIFIEENLRTYS